jgi:trimeric autotransporter adhesin
MAWRKTHRSFYLAYLLVALAFPALAAASPCHGQITFGGFPVPGATVTVTRGATTLTTVSDQGGLYDFPDLSDGAWKIEIEMQGFFTIQTEITIAANTSGTKWELHLLSVDQMMARSKLKQLPVNPQPSVPGATAVNNTSASNSETTEIPKSQEDQQATDGFLINGSVNNAATSRFSLDQAFGNRRLNSKSLYNGGLAAVLDNSALDARPYSLSGLESPKASYNRITGIFTLGGPIHIPRVLPHGPTFFIGYEWTRDHIADTESGLVPTLAERDGDLSGLRNPLGQPVMVFDPSTGRPFPDNRIPVSPQSQALLKLYPVPNISGMPLYNYQVPVLNSSHQDALLSRLDKALGHKDELYGGFNFQSTRASSANLFGFTDATDTLGINANIHWSHRFSQHFFLYSSYRFSRLRTQIASYFENRRNVSGEAGIFGNNQDPANWGPPALNFSSGIAALMDAQSEFNRARTDSFSGSVGVYRGRHNLTIGGDLRKQQFNDFFQQDPRGTFTFTGAATRGGANSTPAGSDLADFLLGVPDTSAIAFGNADKYFRQPAYDLYASDDWRILSGLTINAGLRWEFGEPITELKNRLVNLDVASGFAAVAPVLGSDPIGPLTGAHYPRSLIRGDRLGFEPRIGISWRPIPASTIVVRAGYGVYHDTSVYETTSLALAQQAPLSKSLSVQNSAACPLTLANGFNSCSSPTSNTFAVDPNFRIGYAQTWELTVQRDLPGAIQLSATYLGVKGTHGPQQFLPNTYPVGSANPCTDCPLGFVYQTSGGNSTRQAGQLQLRRRLRSGFTASLLYTYSKSIDDDAYLGGLGHVSSTVQSQGSNDTTPSSSQQGSNTQGGTSSESSTESTTAAVAQNWLDLRAERSLSAFDQRHFFNLQVQYTSGEGLGGGTLMSGWSGRLLKEWTVLTQLKTGTGLPETPIYPEAVSGTGVIGPIRPTLTGAPLYVSRGGAHLNASAYTAPVPGQWGTAGRNSITGPNQFSLDASLARTFRPNGRFNLDVRMDATNLLNHGVFTGWITTVNSTQFGLPMAVNPMRSLETTLRLRF